MNYMSRTSNF